MLKVRTQLEDNEYTQVDTYFFSKYMRSNTVPITLTSYHRVRAGESDRRLRFLHHVNRVCHGLYGVASAANFAARDNPWCEITAPARGPATMVCPHANRRETSICENCQGIFEQKQLDFRAATGMTVRTFNKVYKNLVFAGCA